MVIIKDFFILQCINREVSQLLPRVSTLLLDLAFSHAWKIMFDPSFLICNDCFNMCMHNLFHSLYHYATIFFSKLRFTSSVSLILISVHYDYVCRSCCKCAYKAMIKVIMFILFCYFYDYNYQCSLIIASKMFVSRQRAGLLVVRSRVRISHWVRYRVNEQDALFSLLRTVSTVQPRKTSRHN